METDFKEQVTAAEAIVPNHTVYATYSIREFLPSFIDGLKLINRRILWTTRNMTGKCKAVTVVANTMQMLHPHGDASIYGALIRMCQPFTQAYPLIEPYGNVGAIGDAARPASARYLDVGRSEFAYDVFFSRVNLSTLGYIPDEINAGTEPAFLIPIIPFALLAVAKGIGMGYKCELPMYYFTDVCNLTLKYIQYRKDPNFHPEQYYLDFAKYLVPAYSQYSLIRNGEELYNNYAKNNFNCPIVVDGCMDVYPNRINLRSIPYGQKFPQIYDHLVKEKSKPSFISAHINSIDNLHDNQMIGNIKLTFKRDSDVFEILDQLKKELNFTERITPIFNFSDFRGKVYQLTPYMILERWYIERYRSVLGDLKVTQAELNKQKRETEAKVIVVDNFEKISKIIQSSTSNEEAISRLVDEFQDKKLSRLQAQYICSIQLMQLTMYGKNKLLEDLKIVNNKIVEHTKKFYDIDQIIMGDIIWLRDKYTNVIQKRCDIPQYIGCIHIQNNGIVQFRNIPELTHQLGRWINENPRIEMYPSGKSYHCKYVDGKASEEYPLSFPKVFKAHDFKTLKYKPRSTIVLNDGLIYRADGVTCPKGKSNAVYTPIGEEFSAITTSHILEMHKATDAPRRLLTSAVGVKTDIMYISPTTGQTLVVAYYDKNEVNTVHVGMYDIGEKLNISVISQADVIGIFRPKDPIAFTVPDSYLNRCTLKHLYFKDGESLLDGEKHITLSLNTKRSSNGKNLIEIIKGRDLYGIQRLTKVKENFDFI